MHISLMMMCRFIVGSFGVKWWLLSGVRNLRENLDGSASGHAQEEPRLLTWQRHHSHRDTREMKLEFRTQAVRRFKN